MSAVPVMNSVPQPLARFATRLSREWLPGVAWRLGRTGRAGLVGIGLILATAIFYASTHVPVRDEVAALRTDLATARARAGKPHGKVAPTITPLRSLPTRDDMPDVIGVVLKQAANAHLDLDAGKYDVTTTKIGRVTRYKVSLPIVGPYPQIRQFLDATLTALPTVALSELSIERKSVADPAVEAQVRLTVFTRSAP